MTNFRTALAGRRVMRRAGFAVLACAAIMGAAVTPAAAWWRGGVWIGGPVFIGPPVVYPPPVYYPPPAPVWYTPPPVQAVPPQSTAGPAGQACYAGPYVCPMDRPMPSGGSCYCLSNERSKIWGRAS